MKFLKWATIVIVLIPALLIAGIYVRNKTIGPVGWAEENTIRQLKQKMKDPDSMVVRSSYIVQKFDPTANETTIAMCGVVDGRNSFGGYNGGTRFMSRSVDSARLNTFDTYEVVLEDPQDAKNATEAHATSGFDKVYWSKYCVDPQHPAAAPSA